MADDASVTESNVVNGILFLVTGPDDKESVQFAVDLLRSSNDFLRQIPSFWVIGEERVKNLDPSVYDTQLAGGRNIIAHVSSSELATIEKQYFFYTLKVLYIEGKSAPNPTAAVLAKTVAAEHNIFRISGRNPKLAVSSVLRVIASIGNIPTHHRNLEDRYNKLLADAKRKEPLDKADEPDEGHETDAEDSELEEEGCLVERSAAQEAANFGSQSIGVEPDANGDQFTAIKPWKGSVVEPSDFREGANQHVAPDADLDLEWVHGYRAQDVRNNLRYTSDGSIVYSAAGVGVVYDKKNHSQKHHVEHTDDIICLAVSPDGKQVATGQMGKRPCVLVWDAGSCTTLSCLKGFHKRGISLVTFSDDGSLIASVGQDDNHSVAIYNWAQERKVASSKGDKNKTLDIKFAPSGDQLVSCGVKHVKFWTFSEKGMKAKKGLFGKATIQAMLCIGFLPTGHTVTGTASGDLYVWEGRKQVKTLRGHHNSINAIHTCSVGVCTGGKDGVIRLWDSNLDVLSTFDMNSTSSYNSSVRAVCWDNQNGLVLVGTRGSEIFELSAPSNKFDNSAESNTVSMLEGHCKGELWGLAMHPNEQQYITTGDDKSVRVWDCASHKQIKFAVLDCVSRAVAYSPDGSEIAVGLGGGAKHKLDGAYVILNASTLEVKHEGRDSKEWISDVKYSPDGTSLALGSRDNTIYIYDIAAAVAENDDNNTDVLQTNVYTLKTTLEKHDNPISHLDYSADSTCLQSNCGGYELLFWDIESGKALASASDLRDTAWASWTCTLGWPVQGIWPPRPDGAEVNAVSRSTRKKLLVSADDFGKVKLFKYPCVAAGADACEYRGHSSHVTNIRFSAGDEYVVSIGGHDRSIFQWKVDIDDEKDHAQERHIDDEDVNAEAEPVERSAAQEAANEDDTEFVFIPEPDADSDQFTAIKPWKGSVVEPSDFREGANQHVAPDADLDLEWVHGYRAQDVRNNLRYTSDGSIVYSAAGVGVVYDKKNHSQKHHVEHTDDIICLAVSPDGKQVATGQMGKRPCVLVWDAGSCTTLSCLKGFHKRGISLVTFSDDGSLIASVGQDDNHSVAIYNWAQERKVASSKGDKNKTLDIKFAPSGDQLVSCGVKHVKFWTVTGRNMKCKKGIFGKKAKVQAIMCIGFAKGKTVTGTAHGDLYVWEGRKVEKIVSDAHSKAVNALFSCPAGLASGGKDGSVRLWSPELTCLKAFHVNMASFGSLRSAVRSVCWDHERNRVLVGTRGCEIYELDARDGLLLEGSPLVRAHHHGEVWGLATKPFDGTQFVTCADDCTLRLWDVDSSKLLKVADLGTLARCVAYSPDAATLAVGLETGAIAIFVADTLNEILSKAVARDGITDLKYSPDGEILAVASRDNRIYLFDVLSSYRRFAICKGHSSNITHIDFSEDGQFLQSTCGANELLFWNTQTGKQHQSPLELRDVDWATWTCALGWPVQGVYPPYAEDTVVNAVHRSNSKNLIAYGDDFGVVKLFNYPCTDVMAQCRSYGGHSSHVTNLKFTHNDRHLVTIGGNDKCVFQWTVRTVTNMST